MSDRLPREIFILIYGSGSSPELQARKPVLYLDINEVPTPRESDDFMVFRVDIRHAVELGWVRPQLGKWVPMVEFEVEPELRTKTGKVLTDADIKAFAEEAENGYCVEPSVGYPGRVCGYPLPCIDHPME